MKRKPKDTTEVGVAKAQHLLRRLRDRPRPVVPLADYYRSHSPIPSSASLPPSTTMSNDDRPRDYQMQQPRAYKAGPATLMPVAFPAPTQSTRNPLEVTQEVLRAFANDLRTTEPQTAEWADYLAGRIGQ